MDSRADISAGRAHHRLEAWKLSRKLVTDVYKLTKSFPKEDDPVFALANRVSRLLTGLHKAIRSRKPDS